MGFNDFLEGIPVVGRFFGDSEKDVSKDQQANMEAIRRRYQASRDPMQGARMQALQQTMGLFQPMNDLMARQYGPQNTFDYSQLLQSPMAGYEEKVEKNVGDIERSDEAQYTVDELNRLYKGSPNTFKRHFGDVENVKINSEFKDNIQYNPKLDRWELK